MRSVAVEAAGSSGGRNGLLPLLEAVKDELHARRDAQFIEDPQQIIPDDLLAAGGAPARMVALVCYVATALLGLIGFVGVRAKPVYFSWQAVA
jgi:hypothetical protein